MLPIRLNRFSSIGLLWAIALSHSKSPFAPS